MRTTMFDEGLAMRVPDGDNSKEIGACDVVPTPTNLHASPERNTIQLLDDLEEELNRQYAYRTKFGTVSWLDGPCVMCSDEREPCAQRNQLERQDGKYCLSNSQRPGSSKHTHHHLHLGKTIH